MDRPTFLHHLQRSGLLSEQQIRRAAKRFHFDDPRALISSLLEDGLLTRFQVRQLLRGHCTGLVLGPYRILEQIGKGGVAVVYKAVDTIVNRLVALKVFRPGVCQGSEECLFSFERELQATALLDHPHIVGVRGASWSKGVYFLVMEFVDAPSLDKLVKKTGPLEIGLACELLRQAAVALQYAHAQGLVHRDIKPSNMLVQHARLLKPADCQRVARSSLLLIDRLPALRMLDFGLARLGNRQLLDLRDSDRFRPARGAVWGTLDFISPEQIEDAETADIRSDLYSLGCTFYHMLTGQVPFPGGSAQEKLIRQCLDRPQPVTKFRPDLPDFVHQVVDRLMAKDPSRRFANPTELISELHRARPEHGKLEYSGKSCLTCVPTLSDGAWDTACNQPLMSSEADSSVSETLPENSATGK